MSLWQKLCTVAELNDWEMLSFNSENGMRVLLAKVGGKFYSTDGICTHQYAELAEGFLNTEEKTVTCPLHLSVFGLIDGKPRNPPAELPLKVHQTKVDDGYVYVLI